MSYIIGASARRTISRPKQLLTRRDYHAAYHEHCAGCKTEMFE